MPQALNAELKINIGSGLSGVPSWINIDNSPTITLSRLPSDASVQDPPWPKDVRRHNVIKGLPFPNESVSYIYSSHTFEHFTWEDSLTVAQAVFTECFAWEGYLRIVVPRFCEKSWTSISKMITSGVTTECSSVSRSPTPLHDLSSGAPITHRCSMSGP